MSSSVSISYLVSCEFYLWPLVISSTSSISVPLLILLIVCGFGFSSSTFADSLLFVCLFPFLLGHLATFLCGLSHMSWTSLLLFLLRGLFRVFLLGGLFSELFVCAIISSPLDFFSLGRVCSPLGSSSSFLPSCLATASHGFLLWLPTYAVSGLLPLVMRLYFGCLLAHDGVPGWSSLLVVLFSTVFLTSRSPSSLSGSLSYTMRILSIYWLFSVSFSLSSARLLWLFSFRCPLPVPLPPAFVCAYSLSFAYPLLSVMQFISPVLSCWYPVSFFLFGYLLLSYHSLSLSLVSLPASFPGVLSVYWFCLRSAWGSLFLLHRFLIPLGSHSVSLSFAPTSFRLAVSCFFRYFSVGCHLHVVSGPAFPRYYHLSLHGLFSPSLAVLSWSVRLPFHHFPIVSVVHLPLYVTPVRHFTFLLSRSSDSVESPVPYATGSSLWAESIPS